MKSVSEALKALQDQSARTRTMIENIVNDELTNFGKTLNTSLNAAAITWRKEIRRQQTSVGEEIKDLSWTYAWIMGIPALMCVVFCIGLGAMTWMALPVEFFGTPTTVQKLGEQQTPHLVILDAKWTVCKLADGSQHPCRPLEK